MATANSPSAPFNFIFFGATTLATLSYLSIATTHLHRPSAAVDAVLILTGSNSGFVTYSLRIFPTYVGFILSCSETHMKVNVLVLCVHNQHVHVVMFM